jgi:hypothetical protein
MLGKQSNDHSLTLAATQTNWAAAWRRHEGNVIY